MSELNKSFHGRTSLIRGMKSPAKFLNFSVSSVFQGGQHVHFSGPIYVIKVITKPSEFASLANI